MNYLTTSAGERISRSVFDSRIARAKTKKKKEQFDNEGFNFCEICEQNDCFPVDVSHDISVDKCIKMGTPELAYDLRNMTMRGRNCHKIYDGLDLRFTK